VTKKEKSITKSQQVTLKGVWHQYMQLCLSRQKVLCKASNSQ